MRFSNQEGTNPLLEIRLASAGTWSALVRNRSIVPTLALGLALAGGANAVLAHGHALATASAAPSAEYLNAAARGHPVDLDGTLQVLHEDYPDGTGVYHYFLERDADRFELHFKGQPTQ
jgi:hypothetical protein